MKNRKDKEIRLRVDEDFVGKVDYLQRINGHKNRSETIRKTVEKEYRKEQMKEAVCPYRKGNECKINKSVSFCNIDWTKCEWALKEKLKEKEK